MMDELFWPSVLPGAAIGLFYAMTRGFGRSWASRFIFLVAPAGALAGAIAGYALKLRLPALEGLLEIPVFIAASLAGAICAVAVARRVGLLAGD